MGKRNLCPHCHSAARRVLCYKCKRAMCQDCINTGNLCSPCYDALAATARNRKAKKQ